MIDHDEMPETGAPVDPWSALLPGQELVPAYLTSRFAAQYRLIVDVLLAEQDTSLTGLSYDEVAAGVHAHLRADAVDRLLAPEVLHLDARLERLVQWPVLTRWQEPARSGEDFLRRRDRYQPTPKAAGLHVFWSSVDDTEEAAGDLTLAPRSAACPLPTTPPVILRPLSPGYGFSTTAHVCQCARNVCSPSCFQTSRPGRAPRAGRTATVAVSGEGCVAAATHSRRRRSCWDVRRTASLSSRKSALRAGAARRYP